MKLLLTKLKGLFGQLLEDIGIQLFQSVSKEKAIELIRQCCEYENEYLAKHGADLYPGIEEL